MDLITDSLSDLDIQKTTTEFQPELNANGNKHDFATPIVPTDTFQEETFVSSEALSNASNPVEWDLLVGRGTGSEQANSRWDRQSLYQRFDPLVSQKSQPPTVKFSNAAKIESLMEKIRRDESQFSSPPSSNISKLIPIDTPKNAEFDAGPELNDNNITHNVTNGSNSTQNMSAVSTNMTEETFVSSTELSNASNPLEWDLLVGRGTSSEQANSRWDRQSLYQRFDPLVSLNNSSQPTKRNLNRLESLREQIGQDEPHFSSPPPSSSSSSKLIPFDTPQFAKSRSKMTLRAQAEKEDEFDNATKFIEPLPEFPARVTQNQSPGAKEPVAMSPSPVSSPISSETAEIAAAEFEIENLQEKLELQAQNFQNQLHNGAVQIKELEASIAAASKKLEDQQQANRVVKQYEKSIENFESELEKLTKQIVKIEEEKLDIAQECDFALEDLRIAEYAFSDLHSKYERVKETLNNFKKNEEILLARYENMKAKVGNRDAKLKCLQGTVEDIFGKMKTNYDSEIKSEEIENQRIRAQVKKLEFRMATCEKDLQQKEKENTQLSLLCDDLIKGRQGGKM